MYDVEYKQMETDPLERIANLKNEIIEVKKQIDEYAEQVRNLMRLVQHK